MTISEKLNTIAENQQKIYEAGQKSTAGIKTIIGNPARLDNVSTADHILDVYVEGDTKNLFDISRLESGDRFVNNGDGTLTVTTANNGAGASPGNADATLRVIAPGLEAGKTYVLSATTTGSTKYIVLGSAGVTWNFGIALKVTDDMLASKVVFYASGASTTATISNIQIEEGHKATYYVPYRTDVTGMALWRYGKNILHLDGREEVNFGSGSNTTKRSFTGNGIIVGVTRGNNYVPDYCNNVKVENETITGVSVKDGYGVGFDIRVAPNTTYAISAESRVGSYSVGQFNAEGEWLTHAVVSNVTNTFTTHTEAAWCLIVCTGGGANQPFSITKPQIEVGEYVTEYERGVAPTQYAIDGEDTIKGVNALSPITTLLADHGALITAKYYLRGANEKPFVDTSKGVTSYEYLFAGNRWIDQLDKFDFSNVTNAAYMFQNSSELIVLPAIDTSKVGRMLYYCYNCKNLEKIEGIDFSSATSANNAFYNCGKLESIVINGTIPCDISFAACKLLNKKTIEDVIKALSADATGKTVTFSQAAVETAFTDDEWNALIATKTNWTCGLS